jgi:hypothetical protein
MAFKIDVKGTVRPHQLGEAVFKSIQRFRHRPDWPCLLESLLKPDLTWSGSRCPTARN